MPIYIIVPIVVIVLGAGYAVWWMKTGQGARLLESTYELRPGEKVIANFGGSFAPAGGTAGHLAAKAAGAAVGLRVKQRGVGVAITDQQRLVVAPMDEGGITLGDDAVFYFGADRPVQVSFATAPASMAAALAMSGSSAVLVSLKTGAEQTDLVLQGPAKPAIAQWASDLGFQVSEG